MSFRNLKKTMVLIHEYIYYPAKDPMEIQQRILIDFLKKGERVVSRECVGGKSDQCPETRK